MNSIESIKTKLAHFISVDKFSEYKHLQPAVVNSTEEDKALINSEMNACCTELLNQLEKETPGEDALRKIVRASLSRIKDKMLDTEDEEFCYELCSVIGEILGIDISDNNITAEQMFKEQMDRISKMAGIDIFKLISSKSEGKE